MTLAQALDAVASGERLSREAAAGAMGGLLAEGASGLQVAGFLAALRVRGASADELAGFVDHLRSVQVDISFPVDNLVDSCGTGGGRATINLSTGAAFLAAGAGCSIAKHGNRSVTSACGSADVLEALGISLSSDPDFLKRTMAEARMAFLFAPAFHPALKAVGPIRRELGIRTVFNQLGPLLNPAGARRQIIGVFSPDMLRPMAEALALLGAERAFVVHSADGLDEFSPCDVTRVLEVSPGSIQQYAVDPGETFMMARLCAEDIAQPRDAAEAAAMLQVAFTDPESKVFQALTPNAAACLVTAGIAKNWGEGVQMVRAAGRDGRVLAGYEKMVELSRLA